MHYLCMQKLFVTNYKRSGSILKVYKLLFLFQLYFLLFFRKLKQNEKNVVKN